MREDVPILSDEQRALAISIAREAMELPAAGRASLIKERSGGDTEVEAEVASLLAAMKEMHEAGFLDDPAEVPESLNDPEAETAEVATGDPACEPTRLADGPHGHAVGQRIGEYALKKVIGSGGMGTVYLAQQEKPRRPVALKVMNRGIASRSALRRFEFESQTLGRLRHPNIAQVYEAGTHDDGTGGTPYFAMEYIPNARSLTEYAANKQLGTRERLALFSKVCNAVHHGHQKGIIHRDLKPGNILVDSSGEPKIIDFGVARATDSDMAVTTLQTDLGQIIGTLQYMSPEQCDADPHDLDTRSDVYALGVILYELLTDQLPYDLGRVAFHEAARVIKEETPTRPSTINGKLRGDVETITLKAMEKERERRYESAAELAKDIVRYLNDEPVEAMPPSVFYQIRMFARRNRTMFAATTSIALILIVATIVSLFFAVESNRQARRSHELRLAGEWERTQTKVRYDRLQALQSLLGVESTGIDADSHDDARAVLLDTLAALELQNGDARSIAGVKESFGQLWMELPWATDLSVRLLSEAVAIRREEDGIDSAATRSAYRLYCLSLARDGQVELAISSIRDLLNTIKERSVAADLERATTKVVLARLCLLNGNIDETEELLSSAISIQRYFLGEPHADAIELASDLIRTFEQSGHTSKAGDWKNQLADHP